MTRATATPRGRLGARLVRCALLLLVAVLALLVATPARAGDPPAPNPLRGPDLKTLLESAEKMKQSDPRALGAALVALGEPLSDRGPGDLDFLTAYVVRESHRGLRMLATEAASRIDGPAAVTALLKSATTEKDAVRRALAVEAAGLLGTKEDVPALLDLLKDPIELVATAAADALARLATTKDVSTIVDLGLRHPSSHVTDHTAWIVQDLSKKPKDAVAVYEKIAGKKGDERAVRADATVALLQDKQADPQKWTSPFEAARKALLEAPTEIPVKGSAKEYVESVEASLKWFREKMPAEHWTLCAVVKEIRVPGARDETVPVVADMALDVKLSDAIQPPHKLAYLIRLPAGVLWRAKVGEPTRSHRGWEPSVFDCYDVCVVAKLYSAGPGGISRERFVADILSKRPWGGL